METDPLLLAFCTASAGASSKIQFQVAFCLTCTQAWVQLPTSFLLMNASRSFNIKVDPRGLPEGVHYAEVSIYLSFTCPEKYSGYISYVCNGTLKFGTFLQRY